MDCVHCSTPASPVPMKRVRGWTNDGDESVRVDFYDCRKCGHEEEVDDAVDTDDDS